MFSVLSSAQLLNIAGIGLNQYSSYWIESIFQVLDWINIPGIGLNQYSRYWIESVFQVLDWIMKIKDWIEPKILFTIGLNAYLHL